MGSYLNAWNRLREILQKLKISYGKQVSSLRENLDSMEGWNPTQPKQADGIWDKIQTKPRLWCSDETKQKQSKRTLHLTDASGSICRLQVAGCRLQVAGCRLQVASQNLKNARTVNAKVKTHEQPDFKASNIQTKTEL